MKGNKWVMDCQCLRLHESYSEVKRKNPQILRPDEKKNQEKNGLNKKQEFIEDMEIKNRIVVIKRQYSNEQSTYGVLNPLLCFYGWL